MKKIGITPGPALAKSLRSTSHNDLSALSDIIDNSIDAESSTISLKLEVKNGIPQIIIADDGIGMNEELLVKAITYGYHKSDGQLGKFGMGLKSAGGHLGSKLTVLTKTESTNLIKGVLDWDWIEANNEWAAEVGEPTDSDVELFKELLGDEVESGTIIIISELGYDNANNIYNLTNRLKPHLGRVFRYYISSNKIKLNVNDTNIIPLDPMERQSKDTDIQEDIDIELGDGKIVHATVVFLHKHMKRSMDTDKEEYKGELNYPGGYSWQGVYVVRNNREILAADSTTFKPLWGARHGYNNWVRIELSYSDLDDIFLVNHDKCGIKEVRQSAMDKIVEKLKIHVRQAQQVSKKLSAAESSEDMVKIYKSVTAAISAKKSTLDLPKGKTHKKSSGDKEGTIRRKKTNKRIGGDSVNPTSKSDEFVFESVDYGPRGQLFDWELKQNKLILRWNISHPFFTKYVKTDSTDSEKHTRATSLLLFAIASKLSKNEQENGDEAAEFNDNFIESISSNLRSLSQ